MLIKSQLLNSSSTISESFLWLLDHDHAQYRKLNNPFVNTSYKKMSFYSKDGGRQLVIPQLWLVN